MRINSTEKRSIESFLFFAKQAEIKKFTSMNFNETSFTSINREYLGFIGKIDRVARLLFDEEIAFFDKRTENGILRVARDSKSAIIGDFL